MAFTMILIMFLCFHKYRKIGLIYEEKSIFATL